MTEVTLDSPISLFDKVKSLVGPDTLEVFGPSGSGKTTFALEVARSALEAGKKVVYIDTERNIREDHPVFKYKDSFIYYYYPDLDAVLSVAMNLPKADLYVLDSMGYPVLTRFAMASMNEKGTMLLKAIALSQYLKVATWKNNALAIVTNQPVSEFGKTNVKPEDLPPFGDKSIYAFKCVLRTEIVETNERRTICAIKAYRSRKFGRGKLIAEVRISNDGVNVLWKV